MSPRLVQLSGVILDLIYRVEALPLPGQEALVRGFSISAGGGFNAMVAARRMGLPVGFGGTTGTGPFADIVRRALKAQGIPILRPRLAGHDQGVCVVLVEPAGERSFVASEGADGMVGDADLAGLPLRRDDWLLLSGYALGYAGSRDALTHWLGAQGRKRRLVFDPAPLVAHLAPEALKAALGAALWVTANGAEATTLTSLADPARAAEALAKGRTGGGAVVRVGADGCWLALPDQPALHLPGHPARPVDTNGAGDAHIGAFIALLAKGQTPANAARIANVAAAISTETEGPATAPTLATVLAAMGETLPANDKPSTRRTP
jgi:sugar/nucleoside kinase (ribokinase family)